MVEAANESKSMRSGIEEFSRGSGMSNPGFSKSKEMDVARLSKIRYSGIFYRVKNIANDERTDIEGGRNRSRVRLNIPRYK